MDHRDRILFIALLLFSLVIPVAQAEPAPDGDSLRFPDTVARIQDGRSGKPLWVTHEGWTPQGIQLLSLICSCRDEGLVATDYHSRTLEPYAGGVVAPTYTRRVLKKISPVLEELLMDAYLGLAVDLSGGRVGGQDLPEKWIKQERTQAILDKLASLLMAGDIPLEGDLGLDRYRPAHLQYDKLREALAAEITRLSRPDPAPLEEGPVLKPGQRDRRVLVLRRRLDFWAKEVASIPAGPGLTDLMAACLFDERLARAVKSYQDRQGLVPDGIVGPQTLAALNQSPEDRLASIRLNLERMRWLPRDLGPVYVQVNIPDFRLTVMGEGRELFSTRAIVGRVQRPTPILSGNISSLVVNPFWNVPQKLAREDILPRVQDDPSYLIEHRYNVYENWVPGAPVLDPLQLDWLEIQPWDLAYKFQQNPGPGNPLGKVKFMFTNPFSVYLHDTNHRKQFSHSQRSLSSGCVRVEKPLELAQLLMGLEDPADVADGRLSELLEANENGRIALSRPVPVHFMYLTCWVDQWGVLQFRNDVYGYDTPQLAALEKHQPGEGEGWLAANGTQLEP